MKFKIKSEVHIMGMWMTHEYVHDFPDDSNVFGRVLDYHKHMNATFGNREYRMISAQEIQKGANL